MKKMICSLIFSLVIAVSAFAQNKGPMGGRFDETSSIASIEGEVVMYWLYRLPSYMAFDDLVAELCEYLENRYELLDGGHGWPIYWDLVREWKSNPNLATSVKTMMKRLNRNVSVHIYQRTDGNFSPEGMIINYYDSDRDTYSTLYFPCWK
jgi:hypothetical protein